MIENRNWDTKIGIACQIRCSKKKITFSDWADGGHRFVTFLDLKRNFEFWKKFGSKATKFFNF